MVDMSNNLLQLFNGQITGELLPTGTDARPRLLRLIHADAARFLALAGIGCATPPAEVIIELGATDIAYLRGVTAKPPDEMIRIAHLSWGDTPGDGPETISTFLVR